MALIGAAAAEPITIELIDAQPGFDERTKSPVINFRMSKASQTVFAQFTQQNIGRVVEVRVDGKTVMAPVIREPILGGSGQVSGDFTLQQVSDIAARLRSGQSKMEVEVAP